MPKGNAGLLMMAHVSLPAGGRELDEDLGVFVCVRVCVCACICVCDLIVKITSNIVFRSQKCGQKLEKSEA